MPARPATRGASISAQPAARSSSSLGARRQQILRVGGCHTTSLLCVGRRKALPSRRSGTRDATWETQLCHGRHTRLQKWQKMAFLLQLGRKFKSKVKFIKKQGK
ncbi:hypothetical protein HAX54_052921, partial [Datura stramonium]|nr:hypothetical protein [Datura stramonium]